MGKREVLVVDATGVSAPSAKRMRAENVAEQANPRDEERLRFLSGDITSVMAATSGQPSRRPDAPTPKADELDFRKVLSSVRELGSQNMQKTKNKKELESKKLGALGAKINWKPQTMPYKMMVGVTKARKAKQAKADAEAKAAGIVGHAFAKTGKQLKREQWRSRGGDDDDRPEPSNIRGPVMHIGR